MILVGGQSIASMVVGRTIILLAKMGRPVIISVRCHLWVLPSFRPMTIFGAVIMLWLENFTLIVKMAQMTPSGNWLPTISSLGSYVRHNFGIFGINYQGPRLKPLHTASLRIGSPYLNLIKLVKF
jgi:hypothetical protein